MQNFFDAHALECLFLLHMNHGISLYHSVSLICKVNQIKMETLAKHLGYSRSYLYQNLKGECRLSDELREKLTACIGIDPWNYVPMFDKQSPKPCITTVFEGHRKLGIELQHSFNCLTQWQRVSINTLALQSGVRRTVVYNNLSGKSKPHPSVKRTITHWLGVDPWTHRQAYLENTDGYARTLP